MRRLQRSEEASGGERGGSAPARSATVPGMGCAPPAEGAAGRGQTIAVDAALKRYGSFVALDRVSLEVRGGEFLTLLGPSGSGKTTLLNAIAGFVRLDGGAVRFDGRDVSLLPPHRRGLGVVFQHYALFPHMTVGQNVAFPLRARRVSKAEMAERVRRALGLVQLAGFEERAVSKLSGGQRQRVALARAIVFEPAIILMDEPLSALDKQLRERMQIEIRHLHETLGTTTLYVTHDQREALTMSDRVAVMNGGRLVQVDSPERLYRRPRSRFVADFIGETNLLAIEALEGLEGLVAGHRIRLAEAPEGPGPHLLALRAEQLSLAAAAAAGGANRLAGTVAEVVFQGDSRLVIVALPSGETLLVRQSGGPVSDLPGRGAPVAVAFSPDDAVVVPADGPA